MAIRLQSPACVIGGGGESRAGRDCRQGLDRVLLETETETGTCHSRPRGSSRACGWRRRVVFGAGNDTAFGRHDWACPHYRHPAGVLDRVPLEMAIDSWESLVLGTECDSRRLECQQTGRYS